MPTIISPEIRNTLYSSEEEIKVFLKNFYEIIDSLNNVRELLSKEVFDGDSIKALSEIYKMLVTYSPLIEQVPYISKKESALTKKIILHPAFHGEIKISVTDDKKIEMTIYLSELYIHISEILDTELPADHDAAWSFIFEAQITIRLLIVRETKELLDMCGMVINPNY